MGKRILRSRSILAAWLALAVVWTGLGLHPGHAGAATSATATLVGNLQQALGHSGGNWDPGAAATRMTDLGDGDYRFTGTLPAGTYEYKVAINGGWTESYGIGSYTKPSAVGNGDNIVLELESETTVTFYYNYNEHKIADSTYYEPIGADRAPRLVGSLQTAIGDPANWEPETASAILTDPDYDNVYTVTKTVYQGAYEYKIVLGSSWGEEHPGVNQTLVLPRELPVTFKYNAATHEVSADYTLPVDPGAGVPEGHLRVHYDGPFDGLGLWLFHDVAAPSGNWPTGAVPFRADQTDDYGAYLDIPLQENAQKIGLVVVHRTTGDKDGGDKAFALTSPAMNEVWLKQGSDDVFPYEPVDLPPDTVRVHYSRIDDDYSSYGLWLWDDVAVKSETLPGGWPIAATPFEADKVDRYGAYIDVPLLPGAKKISMIVVNRSTGAKDGEKDKSFPLADRYQRLWIKQGDDNVYISPYGDRAVALVSAEVVSASKLLLGFTSTEGLSAADLKSAIAIQDKDGNAVEVLAATVRDARSVEVSASIDLNKLPLSVAYAGATVSAASGWRMLDEMYGYDGDDLGATYHNGTATLKLWAPTASSVVANLYDKDDPTLLVASKPLTLGEQGVWTATVGLDGGKDIRGYYYQYEVAHDGAAKPVLDPYAKSMAPFTVNTKGEAGTDGDKVGKAAIVDLRGTDPGGDYGFARIEGYEQREDAIIWEAHVRDFTSDPSIEEDLEGERWGTYAAFAKKLDYIRSLGVTHVQLLPVMAWYYGDETQADQRELAYSAKDNEYNWGYDPHNYFTPDGAYSRNPEDPELRIRELKELIHAIHEAGMGVILDVVYTHMANADLLNDIVPGYYAWRDENGNYVGGFGNNLATNRKMAEKLMVDSVKYWFEEYKIDGMRWDMMGDATYDAVQRAYDAAADVNPNALFIGEGWRTFSGAISDPSLAGRGADQDWMDKTDDVGVFSDEIRNELKSGYGSEGEPRFITGGARDIATIFNNIKARPANIAEDDPGDVVPYIEAHDNLTLYDVIAHSIRKDPAVEENDLEIHKRIRLGNLLVLTSQGTAFLHAGQEYGRTKQWLADGEPEHKHTEVTDADGRHIGYFIHDSYDSSDAINMFDWTKATDGSQYPVNVETKDYTAGLIALRKSTDAFRLGDREIVDRNVTLIASPGIASEDLAIGYASKATDGTGIYYVFVNADDRPRTIALSEDLTDGTVVVDDDEAGVQAVADPSGFQLTPDALTLDPLTAIVIRKEAPAAVLTSLDIAEGPDLSVAAGSERQLTVYAKYDDGSRRKVTDQASYASSRPGVAGVTKRGLIQSNSLGETTISVSYKGLTANVNVQVTKASGKRYVQFNYFRPDQDYADWNIWVWGTGARNDQIDFETFRDGAASVDIEVSPDAVSVGFVLRKGTDWETAKQDIPYDRFIPLEPGEDFMKVNVRSLVGELDILPSIRGPILEDGNATFLYRDEEMFRQGRSDAVSGVQAKVGGNVYDMNYDPAKEWFSYTLRNLAVGDHEYSFLVAKNGSTEERSDPTNLSNGRSIVKYRKPVLSISSTVAPEAISSNENAVLKLTVAPSEPVAYREAYLDLTSLGGPARSPFDPELMARTVAVTDAVGAGAKNVTATLVDEYGNKHRHSFAVNVKSRTSAGGKLDFDWDEARIYFILTDRFADGDPTNNENVDKNHLEAYHGGDFRGLIDKLDYIRALGVNTIWITPIVDNIDFNKGADFGGTQYGYHGYWAKDFTKLDEHLGDLDTFKELIDKAHDNGIKIMVDVVLNHVGYGLKPGDNAPGVTQEDKDRFAGMLRTDGVSADTDPIRGELAGLPDFITEDPEVRRQVIEWQTEWLERARTDRGDTIDYFRVDTVKHVESATWIAFKNALTEIDPTFKLIGEAFGATIDADGGALRSGQMDGLLDFGFKEQARKFANGSIDEVDAYLADRESKMDNTATMGQFLSSHDEDGFLSEAVGGDEGKLKIAAALQITAKGQPVIYYGEELGRSGKAAGDMSQGQFGENRADMPWDLLAEKQELHEHYQKLLNIRAKYSKTYAKGVRTKLGGSDAEGYLAFGKQYGREQVVTVIHTRAAAQDIEVPVPFAPGSRVIDEYGGKTYTVSNDRTVSLRLPGRDDGGTAVLGLLSSPGGRPSNGGGSPGAGSDEQPDTQLVRESDLGSGEDGRIVIAVDSGKHEVRIPLGLFDAIGDNDLALNSERLSAIFPAAAREAIRKLVSGADADGAEMRFEFRPLPDDEANEIVRRAEGSYEQANLASQAYELRLILVTRDGRTIPVDGLTEPILLKLRIEGAPNRERIGIHRLHADGAREYVGSAVEDGFIAAKLARFGLHAALEIDRTFADVKPAHWASRAIKALAAHGITSGVTESEFKPDGIVTRAEFAALIVRALGATAEGEAGYADVPAQAWYASSVAAASELGIAQGRADGTFGPGDAIKREEMAAMLVRAWRAMNGDESPQASGSAFVDRGRISAWALPYVEDAVAFGLLQGKSGGRFAPQGLTTRAESAQAIYNLLFR
ncbi:pullulanase [Paenibacillaceae bacterium WGS1546]|uniref:pullulanase n=1 Tax=Cohnella sp. WGS1546 TaxID=3366810 RepID=UPI00372D7DE3